MNDDLIRIAAFIRLKEKVEMKTILCKTKSAKCIIRCTLHFTFDIICRGT